jgi:hypothetical protein
MDYKDDKTGKSDRQAEYEILQIQVRPDLYRAFRRCVWMTVHETGMPIVEIHNRMIEELLRQKEC